MAVYAREAAKRARVEEAATANRADLAAWEAAMAERERVTAAWEASQIEREAGDAARLEGSMRERSERLAAEPPRVRRPRIGGRVRKRSPAQLAAVQRLQALRAELLDVELEIRRSVREARRSSVMWVDIGAAFDIPGETARNRWGRGR